MHKIFTLILLFITSSSLNAYDSNATNGNHFEKVSVQFEWLHQFQFAGYYMAKEKGFYKDLGLDVELKESKYRMNVTKEVVQGRSNFGVGRSSLIVDRIQKNPIVLLGAIFQKSPQILLSLKSSNINTVSDLKNKRVMMTWDLVNSASIVAMLANQKVALEDIKRQDHTFDLSDLIEGNTDVMGSYISNEPYLLEEKGIKYNVLDPADYGFDLYSDIFFTSNEELSKHPDRVQAFYRATLKGWEYAFSHIEETAKLIAAQYNTQSKSLDALIYEGNVLKSYAYVDNIDLGNIDPGKIRRIADVYYVLGASNPGNDLSGLLYSDYVDIKKLFFTKKELNWLKEHPVIKVGVDINYPPFEYIDHMEYKGMVSEYLDIVETKIGIKFQVEISDVRSDVIQKMKDKELDMLGLAAVTEERSKYFEFTKPYLSFPMGIITKDNVSYVQDYKQLVGKKVLVAEGHASHELLHTRYPEMDFTVVSSIEEALKLLAYGDAFAFVGNIATSSYYIKHNGLTNLKVSGAMPNSLEMAMAVRNDWPEFVSILQKAIDDITEKERDEIYNRWLFPNYEQDVDYDLIIKIIIGSIVLLLIPIIWVVLLRRQIVKRKRLEKELKKEIEKTTKLSTTDKLTGINNRLYIDQYLEQEIQRSHRYGNALSILMIDIDDFKNVNDTHGHIIGDEVLIQFVKIISPMTRKTDVLGRWGGEEFLLICTETDLDSAGKVAEEIRSEVEKFSFDTVGKKTVSIGVASYGLTDTIVTLIARADAALYNAKNEGKNRVIMSNIIL